MVVCSCGTTLTLSKTHTARARAKLSLVNTGHTTVECYPVLAVSNHHNQWAYFNEKLSQYLHNATNRIKHKVCSPSRMLKVAKLSIPMVSVQPLSDEEYETYMSEIESRAVRLSLVRACIAAALKNHDRQHVSTTWRLLAMSLTQGGPGIHWMSEAVYRYWTGLPVLDVLLSLELVADLDMRDHIQAV